MDITTTVLLAFAFSISLNLMMYGIAYLIQTDKLTDLSYSLTFIIIALTGYFLISAKDPVDNILLILILVWAFRLGTYLFVRINRIGHDARFNDIRNNPVSFFGFWFMQGISVAIIMIFYILAIKTEAKEVNGLTMIFSGLAMLFLSLEALSDYQKYKFKLKNPGEFMTKGLWKKLRHPNYTGEIFFWLSLSCISAVHLKGTWLLLNFVSPLWIACIIIFFSGIPPLEKIWKVKYKENKAFKEYWNSSWRLIPYIY